MPRRRGAAVVALAALLGCGEDAISVRPAERGAYGRDELLAAVSAYAGGPRTPEAFGALVRAVAALRPKMDEPVAAQAELQLTVLAVDAVEAVASLPWPERTARLATTVWPLALAPEVEALAPDGWRAPDELATALRDGEGAEAYVARLCTGAYVVDCKHVVPEWQGAILGTIAVGRLTERARAAVQDCDACTAEPGWAAAVKRWEALDVVAQAERAAAEDAGATERWPAAGPAAAPWAPVAVSVEVEDDGDWVIDGATVALAGRVGALVARRDAPADGAGRGVAAAHLAPGAPVTALDAVIAAARAAGYTRVVVEAREPVYPWTRRGYAVELARLGRGARLGGVPADATVQTALRALDARAPAPAAPTGPGAAAPAPRP